MRATTVWGLVTAGALAAVVGAAASLLAPDTDTAVQLLTAAGEPVALLASGSLLIGLAGAVRRLTP